MFLRGSEVVHKNRKFLQQNAESFTESQRKPKKIPATFKFLAIFAESTMLIASFWLNTHQMPP